MNHTNVPAYHLPIHQLICSLTHALRNEKLLSIVTKRTPTKRKTAKTGAAWRLSDGTRIELGGQVFGRSKFARELREDLAHGVHVTIWAHPAPALPVDTNDVALMNAWIEERVGIEQRCSESDVEIDERPEQIPALPPSPYRNSDDPGVIYSPLAGERDA